VPWADPAKCRYSLYRRESHSTITGEPIRFGMCASEAISSLYFPQRGEASLGRAAELAGVPVGQMMTILTEFGVESKIEHDDYLQGLAALRKTW
jgi:hypothetical protein